MNVSQKDAQRIEDQNTRMREWFKKRTGLESEVLADHMREVDRLLGTTSDSEDHRRFAFDNTGLEALFQMWRKAGGGYA